MEIRYKRFIAVFMPICKGFIVSIYADTEQKPLLEEIRIAVGRELLTGDETDVIQFVKDYIDSEIKALRKLMDETEGYV